MEKETQGDADTVGCIYQNGEDRTRTDLGGIVHSVLDMLRLEMPIRQKQRNILAEVSKEKPAACPSPPGSARPPTECLLCHHHKETPLAG